MSHDLVIPAGAVALIPQDMDQAIRLAHAMASSRSLPKFLHDDTGTCLMIVDQAMRWRMSPFAVAQCTANIGGKLMYEGKLVAAAVESSGAIEGGFDYDYAGEGDERQVTVSARRVGETNKRQLTVKLKDVRTAQGVWKTQPDQQLAYSGVRSWARRYTPAALLGVYAPEEFDRQTRQIVTEEGKQTIDGTAEEAAPTRREEINRAVPLAEARKMTLREWLDDFEARCAAAGTEAVAEAILKEEAVLRLDDPDLRINEAARRRALAARQAMVERIWKRPPEDEAALNDDPFAATSAA